MALTKLTSNLIEGGTGTDWVTAIQTSNFTAAAGKGYFVNTTSQVLYVNLPVGVVGMEITIQDYAGTFATNQVTLNANGSEKIQGSAFEGKITTNNATAVLIYQDATKGWTSQDVTLIESTVSWVVPTGQSLTYSTPSPQSSQGVPNTTFPTTTFTVTKAGQIISGTATIAGLPTGITAAQVITGSGGGNTLTVTLTGTFPATSSLNTSLTLSGLTITLPTYSVNYLVVAGGGGGSGGYGDGAGGIGGAGGGAGGLRTTTLSVNGGTNLLITVGAGGTASGTGFYSTGGDGNDSVFSTITSLKGGRGGSRLGGLGSGGSGTYGSGGASAADSTTAGTTNAGTAGQGNSSGGTSSSGTTRASSGGGGSASAGITATTSSGGNGGNKTDINITGSSVAYAGGGGGGATVGGNGGTSNMPSGSTGGASAGNASNGTAYTGAGGGGGGGGYGAGTGGTGGSGVVILRYTGAIITNPGAGLTFTTVTVGSDKVTTFTAGTGNIQFN